MLGFHSKQPAGDILHSRLLDQDNFYDSLMKDLSKAKHEVIIESPFVSLRRLEYLRPVFRQLIRRKVRIIINTKPAEEQDSDYRWQAEQCITILLQLGVEVLVTGGHHRKIAIIDKEILYEGSLNILSQNDSCEVMRRIHSEQLAKQMIDFVSIGRFVG